MRPRVCVILRAVVYLVRNTKLSAAAAAAAAELCVVPVRNPLVTSPREARCEV